MGQERYIMLTTDCRKVGEDTQINEITQNQVVKGGKPKLESHETPTMTGV